MANAVDSITRSMEDTRRRLELPYLEVVVGAVRAGFKTEIGNVEEDLASRW